MVEYAIILVLVAVVAIVLLVLLGPAVGDLFSQLTTNLQSDSSGTGGGSGGNVIVSVSATRTGGGHGNSVKVTITVSTATSVTVTDSQSGSVQSGIPCNGSCTVTIGNVGDGAGEITVIAAAGGTVTSSYDARS